MTVSGQIQVAESNADDNINQVKLGVRVIGIGGTVRSTLMAVAAYGTVAEIAVTTPRNATVAVADALGSNYTSVAGDRLVIELGVTDATGLSPAIAMALGMAEEDCPVDDTTTSERAPWIEFSSIITFVAEGPTRLYMPTAEAAAVTPAFDGNWEDVDGAVRRRLRYIKDLSNTFASGTPIGWTAGQDALDRQYVSDPMVAGQVFNTSVIMQGICRALESAVNDNVTQIKAGLRIVSNDGNTVRATLLAVANHSGSTTELGTTSTVRRIFNSTALTGTYVTADGDRIVLELGYSDDGTGASILATGSFGMSDGDAPYAFVGGTTTCSPWVEFSIPIRFKQGFSRFYFSVTEPTAVECPLDPEWEYVLDARYRRLRYFKDESTIATGSTIGNWTPGQDAIDRQYVSDPMVADILFSPSTTVKMQLMTREAVATDEVGIAKLGLRIVSLDGQTVWSTLLPVANYSPTTTEFDITFRNKTFANGDALQATYVTKEGDRLVVEYGYTDTAGTSPGASANVGCEAADLAENEVDTVAAAGWIELSQDIYFLGLHAEEIKVSSWYSVPPAPYRSKLVAVPY